MISIVVERSPGNEDSLVDRLSLSLRDLRRGFVTVLSVLLLFPAAALAQGRDYRPRQGHVGRRAARRDCGSGQPGPD